MTAKAASAALALTPGEPAGVGAEIALKAWTRRTGESLPAFFLLDDPAHVTETARALNLAVPLREIADPAEAPAVFAEALPVLSHSLAAPSVSGHPDPANAPFVWSAIERAVALTRRGLAAGVVTNPLHKGVLYAAGFHYPGHTEYLAALAGITTPPVMMLTCPALRTVPVTVHVGLAQALRDLSLETIVETGRIVDAALRKDFGLPTPRLAVAGLNPHAGENGALGDEEPRLIAPAIVALRELGIDARGPLPADTLFAPHVRAGFDAALCMYHDQALIPVKALDFSGGVNVTLGLPFVRTSPDHGTALDIAGHGKADPASLMAALRLAGEIAGRRAIGG